MNQALITDPGTTAPSRSRSVLRWWPSMLAIAMSVTSWGIDAVTAGQLMPLLPLIYVGAVVIGRRSASWPLLALGGGGFVALQSQSAVDPLIAFAAVGALLIAVGAAANPGREFVLQAGALVLWLALVFLATAVSSGIGVLLVALGWGAHGGWDVWHLLRRKAVSASYAQWCAVFDVLLAAQLMLA